MQALTRSDRTGGTSAESSSGPAKKERKLSTISAEPTQERSTKTDNPKDLKPRYLPGSSESEDKVRDRGVTMYYDALAFDSIAGEFLPLMSIGKSLTYTS